MARPADFDLGAAVAAAGFTPAIRDMSGLIELVEAGDEATAQHAARALTRLPPDAVIAALTAGSGSDEARAARRITALGQVARAHPGSRAGAALIAVLGDDAAAPRARRAAVVALGKVGGDAARAALLAYWDQPLLADHRRAVTEALGKLSGTEALERLSALDPGGDAELARRRDRAVLMIERTAARGAESEVAGDVAPPFAVTLVARCRGGLEGLLADELTAQGLAPGIAARGEVTVRTERPLDVVWRARTLVSAGVMLPLPRRGEEDGDALADAIAAVLSEGRTVELLRTWTRGPVRWRLDFASGGHRRAVVWKTAQRVAARRPELVNDPTATTWDVVIDEDRGRIELRPRRIADRRFAWRVRDVPAASHPTIAAALARVAGVRADDRVWDPFCGSGAELIERALLGPFQRLIGSDLDPRALVAAGANLEAAGLSARAELIAGDATALRPDGTTLIVTNPPLGRRLRGDAPALLERFVAHAATVLVPGGRLVWITPVPRRTARAARQAGLRPAARLTVDLGGFDGQLESWIRPA